MISPVSAAVWLNVPNPEKSGVLEKSGSGVGFTTISFGKLWNNKMGNVFCTQGTAWGTYRSSSWIGTEFIPTKDYLKSKVALDSKIYGTIKILRDPLKFSRGSAYVAFYLVISDLTTGSQKTKLIYSKSCDGYEFYDEIISKNSVTTTTYDFKKGHKYRISLKSTSYSTAAAAAIATTNFYVDAKGLKGVAWNGLKISK